MESAKCGDCQTEMEIGFVPDHYVQISPAQWHPGVPDQKTLMGHIKMEKSKLMPIAVFRCTSCGLLKFVAK